MYPQIAKLPAPHLRSHRRRSGICLRNRSLFDAIFRSELTGGRARRALQPSTNRGRDAHFLSAPRTDPYGPNSGIRLPPWVHDGESLFRPGVKDSRFGKPVVRQLREPLPTHAVLLAASPQRSLPEFSDRVTERVERATVRRHGVVVEVAADDPAAAISPARVSADACAAAFPV